MTPPSPPVGGGGTHVPLGAPASMKQIDPAQQSPVAVQVPPDGTQTTPPSLGVVVRQRYVPVASGTQGIRLQHSAEVLQVSPGLRQQFGSVPLKMPVPPSPPLQVPLPRQRGRPSRSKAQHCTLGLTGQSQSLWALVQALPPGSLQMPPATWLPWFWAQAPMLMSVGPVTGLQLTAPVSAPQHSAALVQRLFRILQPRPGWQTSTPVTHGPQILLQQLPHPLQITPSCWQEPVPVVLGFWQVPSVAPAARWQ